MSIIHQTKIALFVDETNFYSSHKNINYAIANLERKINTTIPRFEKWELNLNVSKTVAVLIGPQKKKPSKNQTISGTVIAW